MKAVMVMFDSLNRRMLPNYGCEWVKARNFVRLGSKSVTFDNCYAGSLPCMPARRELHTGRYNFLHRSWGPLEPFDDSLPELLRQRGIYTHLVSDHNHYWEDGGATYHTRYSSFEFFRGQEGDPWKGQVRDPEMPAGSETRPQIPGYADIGRHDVVNRAYMQSEEHQPQARTFAAGLEFIEANRNETDWFLQIETFDPHEPFFTQQRYKDLYPHHYAGPPFDWPPYDCVKEGQDVIEHARYEYAALLSMCDHYLGMVLDAMDRYALWDDTMLIVNTDHGYLLGERGWWSKTVMPVYNEIAHIPLFCYDPRVGTTGERRQSLVQTIDIAPTLLDFFDADIPARMQGRPLRPVLSDDTPIRRHALFGYHGGHLNITDGSTLYMRAPATPDNAPLYEYTLMPAHMRAMFAPEELAGATMAPPFSFTKGCPVMKIGARSYVPYFQYGDRLYDLRTDPGQERRLDDDQMEAGCLEAMRELVADSDAPEETFDRFAIPREGSITGGTARALRAARSAAAGVSDLDDLQWDRSAQSQFTALVSLMPSAGRPDIASGFRTFLTSRSAAHVTTEHVVEFARAVVPEARRGFVTYLVGLAGRFD